MRTGFVSINEYNTVRNTWIALVSFVDRSTPVFYPGKISNSQLNEFFQLSKFSNSLTKLVSKLLGLQFCIEYSCY